MTETPPGFAKPTEEHAWLARNVGRWTVDCSFFMDPSAPPLRVQATDTVEAHGPFFTVARFEADMMGMPFAGLATTSYSPVLGRFRSTWADTLSPHLFFFEGQRDPETGILEMTAEAPEPNTQRMTTWRTTEQHQPDGSRVFEMFLTLPDTGTEFKLFTQVYRRADG